MPPSPLTVILGSSPWQGREHELSEELSMSDLWADYAQAG